MLTQTQWMWIIGIAAVLLLGGLAWNFYSKGELGMRGVQFETGAGLGAPSQNPLGQRHKQCLKGGCDAWNRQGMSCNTGVLLRDNECEMGICKNSGKGYLECMQK